MATPLLDQLNWRNEFGLSIFKIQNLALLYMVLLSPTASNNPEIVVNHMGRWTSYRMNELLFQLRYLPVLEVNDFN
jgi:hypothetical protein